MGSSRNAEHYGRPVHILTAAARFQAAFIDSAGDPENRAIDANFDLTNTFTVEKIATLASHFEDGTDACRVFSRDGDNAMMVAVSTDGSDGNDVVVRVTRWYPLYIPERDDAKTKDGNAYDEVDSVYIPVAYDFTFTTGTATGLALTDVGTGDLFADTVVETNGPGEPDVVLYSPAGQNLIATAWLDMHGAPMVSVEVKDGSSPPNNAQVWVAFE